ncbi:MAG TPA: hypothetical protein VIU40_08550 [Geobacteraceae bacterium]
MDKDTDERKRAHLRLVVNNPEKRQTRPAAEGADYIPLPELVAQRDQLRNDFYRGMERRQTKAFTALESYLAAREWPYGLDPEHGNLLVLPAEIVAPETVDYGVSPQDEALLSVTEDVTKLGLCLTLEMILPFYSEDDAVMEEALLYSPMLPYGTLFLEENRQDGFLDLIYRLAFPLYPALPSARLFDKLFAVAAYELHETLRCLAEYPEA